MNENNSTHLLLTFVFKRVLIKKLGESLTLAAYKAGKTTKESFFMAGARI